MLRMWSRFAIQRRSTRPEAAAGPSRSVPACSGSPGRWLSALSMLSESKLPFAQHGTDWLRKGLTCRIFDIFATALPRQIAT
ncbi:hypothetical protein DIE28_14210 [Paracoccus thiocyanatus]|uniref:Uncharacterized protein n=1 Tax=Paracoccus thiocyanatus TaxID=34006 RepID=A0A3D8P8E5_9RHOB|nr:hypothetical protein DIE28_14210 [Paracoccus thiocyanatus]